jgi:aryl-alcohol dehydrogenase-like predicted oxidoreductase
VKYRTLGRTGLRVSVVGIGTWQLVEQIRRAEVPDGVDLPACALAWCLRHPAVAAAVVGCKSVEHVEANARAADLDLVPTDHPQAAAAP